MYCRKKNNTKAVMGRAHYVHWGKKMSGSSHFQGLTLNLKMRSKSKVAVIPG